MDGVVIKLVITDCDGVLTDNGVYYDASGEVLKRFSIRDGMGVERLRVHEVETAIISGEASPSLRARAAKLKISEQHLGVRDKVAVLDDLCARKGLDPSQVAYIGDDVNDVPIMRRVGLSGCPGDATDFARDAADVVCVARGGHGAFREFAEAVLAHNGTTTNHYEEDHTP
ncbi:MAG: HAD-IIIA family hydrolase [Acidimicrobiia bacterium]|nr:HAD-IIIA family hydrolase [Acidimicrobiia bacterium]